MCTKLGLNIEKKTPYRVLFIRAAELMIVAVFRQAIDMTAREGDQDWSGIALFARFQVVLHISQGSLEIGSPAVVVECSEPIDVGAAAV